jgi:hypothetical protein
MAGEKNNESEKEGKRWEREVSRFVSDHKRRVKGCCSQGPIPRGSGRKSGIHRRRNQPFLVVSKAGDAKPESGGYLESVR